MREQHDRCFTDANGKSLAPARIRRRTEPGGTMIEACLHREHAAPHGTSPPPAASAPVAGTVHAVSAIS
jgi:hypothetical protein